MPLPASTRHDAHGHDAERARASSRLVSLILPLTTSRTRTQQYPSNLPDTLACAGEDGRRHHHRRLPPRYCELASPSRSRQRTIFSAIKRSVLAMTSPTPLRHRPTLSAIVPSSP
jgi:hypothetical protein